MAIRPLQVNNRERDLSLVDREEPATIVLDPSQPDVLSAEMRRRIAAARVLRPAPRDAHCVDCYTRGVRAALRVIEGEE